MDNRITTRKEQSQQLMQCLVKLETENRQMAKIELVTLISELMPQGAPNYQSILTYPTIRQLEAENGRKTMLKATYLIILDFCKSLNLTRNMTDDQIIEAAAMLLDKAGTYRLEDYVVMFTMAKHGHFDLKLYEGIDIMKIAELEKAYDKYSLERIDDLETKSWDKLEKGMIRVPVDGVMTEMTLKEYQARKFCAENGYDYELSKENLFKEADPCKIYEALSSFADNLTRERMHEHDEMFAKRREDITKQQEAILRLWCRDNGISMAEALKDWEGTRTKLYEAQKQALEEAQKLRDKKNAA